MVYRNEIRLTTMDDILTFVKVVTAIDDKTSISLEDSNGNRVNARSILGAIYTLEWKHIFCVSSKDISGKILRWII